MEAETILVVDDEIANLQKLHRTFVNRYPVLAASSGKAALDLVSENEQIAVIIADQRMPDITGIDFLRQTVERLPDAVRIILTGFTDTEVLMDAINSCKVFRYIVKPWDPQDLLMTVERGLEAYRLAKENDLFRKELVRRERLARELEIARDIQRYILPSRCPEIAGYGLAVEYHPAREVGGDLYDFYWSSEALQLVIGDVSGKSIPAALYGAVFSGQLQMIFARSLSPAQAIAALNKNLVARYQSGNYISVAYCDLDLRKGSAILANGGMPFPFVVRGDVITRLPVSGVPLGLMERITPEEFKLQLEPGDTLLLLSDGVTDALNAQDEFYDLDRFTESAIRHSEKGISEYVTSLYSDLRRFTGNAELSDDVTIIGLRRLK